MKLSLGKIYKVILYTLADTYNWWRRMDKRWGMWWRVGNVLAVTTILAGVAVPILQQIMQNNQYKLSAASLKLVGQTDPILARQLSYDAASQTYQFNKDAVQAAENSNPVEQLKRQQAQVGTASGQGKDKSLYGLDVPADFSKGATYHDVNSGLSFSLVPQFDAMKGQTEQGHLVFPMSGGGQAVYTLKNNGLKEDIVVQKAVSDSMTLSYHLDLPKTLAVKVIPDSGGEIGIYGPDPSLLGNISYGSSKDRALVQKARENADKTNLIFGLPSPVVKDTHGNQVGSARFVLHGTTLQVVASGLSDIKTPFTIDPSVVVTSTSDFQTGGNNEGMIDFSTSGQIARGGLTGGSVSGGWSVGNSIPTASYAGDTVAYNGYIYYIGGVITGSGGTSSYVQYASVGANGVLGAWHYTCNSTDSGVTACSSLLTTRYGLSAVAYNGYMYVMGGRAGSNYYSDTQYAPINADGTIGTWQYASSFTNARYYLDAATYDGYLYILGGYNGTSSYNDTQYAPINADGTIGTWQATTSFTTARYGLTANAYNGYIYIMGGNGGGYHNDVQYAPINSDGTIGAWQSTASFATARYMQSSSVYNGYLYIFGGRTSTYYSDVQYAQINANGSLGPWKSTSSFATPRAYLRTVAYNGYLYLVAGYNGTTLYSDTQYAKIDPAGITGNFLSTTPLTVATQGAGAIAYNGYMYYFGGNDGVSSDNNFTYYAPINADGTLGAWTKNSLNFSTTRDSFIYAAYNGYMYVMSGENYAGTVLPSSYYAPINADGSVGTWVVTTSLSPGRKLGGGFAYNGYMYVLGGLSSTSYLDSIYYAPITSNGSLGSWTALANYMPNNIAYLAATVSNGYIYVLGGYNNSGQNAIYYTHINADGTVGSWTTSSVTLTQNIQNFSVVADNGFLYIMGGNSPSSSSPFSAVQYAPVNSNGSIGDWQTSASLSTAVYAYAAVAYNGYLYILGGNNGSTAVNNVQYASINNGGSGVLGSWTSGSSFTTPRAGQSSVAYGGYIYVIGGNDIYGNRLSDVQYAQVKPDGSLGAWASTASFSTGRYGQTSVECNGYLYIMGGQDSGGNLLPDVQSAKVNADGTLNPWQSATNLPKGIYYHSSVVVGNYIYVIGGSDGSSYLNSVYYAASSANGVLGSWQTANSFTNGRFLQSAVSYDGYVYVMGGTGIGSVYYSDVQFAKANSDGSLGTWAYTESMNGPMAFFSAIAYDGFMYTFGGSPNGTAVSSGSQVASINADGTLGVWQATTSFSNARKWLSAEVVDGTLYLLGGGNATVYYNDVQYSSMASISRVGHYSKLIDLGSAVNVTGISYTGTLPGGTSSIVYRAAGSNGVFGSSAIANGISGVIGCIGTTTNTRYLFVMISLDDSLGQGTGGGFSDTINPNANLTDFTVNYNPVHPPPNIRLRLGQTLQQGNLSPLDTCYP